MKASELPDNGYIFNIDDFEDKAKSAANALIREIENHIRDGKQVGLIGEPEIIFDKESLQYFIRQKYQTKRVVNESD